KRFRKERPVSTNNCGEYLHHEDQPDTREQEGSAKRFHHTVPLAPAPRCAPEKCRCHDKTAANYKNEWQASSGDHDRHGNDAETKKSILGSGPAGQQEISLHPHRQNPEQNRVTGKTAGADKYRTRRK